MTPTPVTYKSSGVSYDALDALKRLAQCEGAKTARASKRIHQVEKSRGESAFVWEEKDAYRALVVEGLGTKNLVADEMRKITGPSNGEVNKTYYDAIAQDAVAAIVNDLIVVGAAPQVINAYFAVGNSGWFSDKKRTRDLVSGWAKACRLAGVVWGGGETPALKNIIEMDTIDLAGSAIGIIKPKRRLTLGDKIKAGDAILLIESSGIHANGLTLARAIAAKLPKRYGTMLPDGIRYGEALLRPTHIYARLVNDLFDAGIDIHYMVNITGHGWRKLMRVDRDFSYILETVPTPQPVFRFIQEHSGNDNAEMYGTFNMGAGFALYMPKTDIQKAQKIASKHRLKTWGAGYIEKGEKCVVIKPKHITFSSKTLSVR